MIYLDHAATTKPRKEVVEAMLPYLGEKYYNPSAYYRVANNVKNDMETARARIALCLQVQAGSIYFTGGGTESDNWAIRAAIAGAGIKGSGGKKGKHIISTRIEHPAVSNTLRYLEENGCEVTRLGTDRYGMISVDELADAIRENTVLISVMHANNEIGTIEPIEEIGRIAHERGVLFHTDAVQSFGHIPIDMSSIDLLSASSHKIYGPKGVGLLYINPKIRLGRMMFGGNQEMGRRPGTENVAGIMGFAKAAELIFDETDNLAEHDNSLRERLKRELSEAIPGVRFSGHPDRHLPGILSVTFEHMSNEVILIGLDREEILASAGSACSTGAMEPSKVLKACGASDEEAHGTIRFSIGRENTEEDIDETVRVLKKIVNRS